MKRREKLISLLLLTTEIDVHINIERVALELNFDVKIGIAACEECSAMWNFKC
jgi:hypothetical protein